MISSQDLGPVTAYAIAVKYGFSGTEQEWANAVDAQRQAASASATSAANSASEALTAANSAKASATSISSITDSANAAANTAANSASEALTAANSAKASATSISSITDSANAAATRANTAAKAAEDSAAGVNQTVSAANTELQSLKTQSSDIATAETARVDAEGKRATAEQGRVDAESARVTAEQARQTAESDRQTAETARESASQTAVNSADAATTRANTAAKAAEGVVAGDLLIDKPDGTAGYNRLYIDDVQTVARDTKTTIPAMRTIDTQPTFKLYGYSHQDGVPTPENPIDPVSLQSPLKVTIGTTDYSIPLTASDTNKYQDGLELRAVKDHGTSSIPDSRDYIGLGEDGRWKIYQNVNKKVVQGVEGEDSRSAHPNQQILTFDQSRIANNTLWLNSYTDLTQSSVNTGGYWICFYNNASYYWFDGNKYTLEQIQAMEKQHPMVILYGTYKTTVIDLSDDAQTVLNKMRSAIAPLANGTTLDITSTTEMDIISRSEMTKKQEQIDSITASMVTAEYIKAHYADIDLANIASGTIKTAMIDTGAVGTAQIADGSITDAKIVELTADKITAGTLSVERLVITGSDKSIVYAINDANGTAQLSQTTVDGGSLTQRSITADRIVAGAITADEIAAHTITANELAVGTITAESGVIGSIDASKITTGMISADRIDTANLKAQRIYSTDNNIYAKIGTVSFENGLEVRSAPGITIYGGSKYHGGVAVTYDSSYGWYDWITMSDASGENRISFGQDAITTASPSNTLYISSGINNIFMTDNGTSGDGISIGSSGTILSIQPNGIYRGAEDWDDGTTDFHYHKYDDGTLIWWGYSGDNYADVSTAYGSTFWKKGWTLTMSTTSPAFVGNRHANVTITSSGLLTALNERVDSDGKTLIFDIQSPLKVTNLIFGFSYLIVGRWK